MDFAYSKDIGVNSIPALTALANSSGITLPVISGYRAGAKGLHGTQNAIDIAGSADAMRQVAAYLYQYSAYLLELIHTNYTVDGGGYYVKNGLKVPQSRYDAPDIDFPSSNIIKGHVNHIHLAATMSGLQAASADVEKLSRTPEELKLWERLTGDKADSTQNSNVLRLGGKKVAGCLPVIIGFTVSVGTLLTFVTDLL